MSNIVKHVDLATADLFVGVIYEGQLGGQLSGEPLSKLLPGIGNLGGFRPSGIGDNKNFVVLCTSGEEKEWPDWLNMKTGQFFYFGDNRIPGVELHDTPRGGNRILRQAFELIHAVPHQRESVFPFFVFQKHATQVSSRSYQFKGLAVPGGDDLPETMDLVAFWKTIDGQRFLNYRAVFTILDAPLISRAWLDDLRAGNVPSGHAPPAWQEWVETGKYRPLSAQRTDIRQPSKRNITVSL